MNVKAERLSLTYGKHEALKQVSFELDSKKIYGLLGRNGAGKTSLLSIIASFIKPSSGELTINGEVPFENADIMQQVALLYNKDYQDETDNIKDMLSNIERYRPQFDRDYADALIKTFKLDVNKPISKLSKGMQAALNVTIGLATRAPITIFDEVYLGMDAPARELFYKALLKDQENHPRMVILSTHLVSEMDYLFDDVILIHEGNILLHEDYHSLIEKGVNITGDADAVDSFVQGKTALRTEQLGHTKSVMLYGELTEAEERLAISEGLEIGPVALQDLFIHLTEEEQQ
ncbi:ATP-binding cassette domain-containing protein [Amphibacillus cookii]|uniref:ATP-binding cassette domain-containing protein n=1 Tax=Amphibacillus cookii TaxID=767787 RepID=UPI0019565C51|nr:ABC transporter ATP-binding protein [Amphibacillus cookii]MBM7539800.1 ABC-2 type transport system ATP-binding protein [Amphibacillus cookii]